MRRSARIDHAVAKLDRLSNEQLAHLSQSPAAQALLREVTAMDHDAQARASRVSGGVRSRRRLIPVVAAAAGVTALVFALTIALRPAPPAAAAVQFRTSGQYIVATVVNPYAAEQQLDAAFAAHGLQITLKLVPVSPSLVGSVVYMGSSADASQIGVLYSKTKQAPGGPLPIGLRIPVDFRGSADIVLGRAARAGETYVSTGDAFAPGEALHGSGLLGMQVSAALAKLRQLGLSAQWRVVQPAGGSVGNLPAPVASPAPGATPVVIPTPSPLPTGSPQAGASASPAPGGTSQYVDPSTILNYWVIGADPVAAGRVLIFTQAQKPSAQ